jgi:hypothetical protein
MDKSPNNRSRKYYLTVASVQVHVIEIVVVASCKALASQ